MKTSIKAMFVIMAILSYHFAASDKMEEKSPHAFWASISYMNCEGGTCEEKGDHRHEHKKKKSLRVPQIIQI